MKPAMTTDRFGLPPGICVLERGWLSSNNILFLDAQQTTLVDSGYVTHAPQTLALVAHVLRERGRPDRLDRLINTHLHSDHCGGNAALQDAYPCRVTIPLADAARVACWDEDALSFRETGQQCPRFRFDDTLQDGDELQLGGLTWTALATPGHDPHALILYCAQEGILISADALWQNGFGVIFPELEGLPGFDDTRATLELIAGLDVRVVIPGHGAPFTDTAAALTRSRARLDYLQADPVRNARNGVKVMLKFLLLEKRAIALARLPAMMAAIPLLASCNQRFFGLSDAALATWAVEQLLKAGAAATEGDYLLDAG